MDLLYVQSVVTGDDANHFSQVCRAEDCVPGGSFPRLRWHSFEDIKQLHSGGCKLLQCFQAILDDVISFFCPPICVFSWQEGVLAFHNFPDAWRMDALVDVPQVAQDFSKTPLIGLRSGFPDLFREAATKTIQGGWGRA
jgi:hypothetical protein